MAESNIEEGHPEEVPVVVDAALALFPAVLGAVLDLASCKACIFAFGLVVEGL